MKITIDLRITGCQTRCWHCYVNGGPGSFMSLSEIMEIGSFLRRAVPIFKQHFSTVSPYLDLEPVSHPDIVKIIQFFASENIIPFNESIPTTGVSLAQRDDYHEVLNAFKKIGIKGFEFTLHGDEQFHNKTVSNRRALEFQLISLKRIKEYGFEVYSNVMISKKLVEDFDEVCQFLTENVFDSINLTVPIFVPTDRLRKFEVHRANLDDIATIIDNELFRTCLNNNFWLKYKDCTEKAFLKKISDFDSTWEDMINKFPQWVFITILPGLDLYYGNGNLLHNRIGNIKETEFEMLIESIMKLKSNYCINGYYNTDLLPPPRDLIQEYGQPSNEKVYPSLDDVIMLCIDRCQKHL